MKRPSQCIVRRPRSPNSIVHFQLHSSGQNWFLWSCHKWRARSYLLAGILSSLIAVRFVLDRSIATNHCPLYNLYFVWLLFLAANGIWLSSNGKCRMLQERRVYNKEKCLALQLYDSKLFIMYLLFWHYILFSNKGCCLFSVCLYCKKLMLYNVYDR